MSDFADRLGALVAKEMAEARRDPDRMGALIERLSCTLGFTIAIAARGNGEGIDNLVAGAEGYIHSEAVAKAPFARAMARWERLGIKVPELRQMVERKYE